MGNIRAVVSGDGRVLETNNYYPYGMQIKSLSQTYYTSSDVKNRYKYNGKEEFTDNGLDWLDYGARMYDVAVGRIWTQDNYSEKYAWMSPYQFAGNSPVMNIDVNGDSLTDAAWEQASRKVEYALAQIERNNNKLVELEEKVKQGKISPKKYLRRKKKIENAIDEYNQTLYELYVLDESSQIYDVRTDDDLREVDGSPVVGKVTYDLDNNVFVISVTSDDSDLGAVAHEFKHAYQFETGELGFTSDGRYSSHYLLDKHNELEANDRSGYFGTRTITTPQGGERKRCVRNIYEAKKLYNLNVIFRYEGKTYDN